MLTKKLGKLESCGFVRSYRAFGKKKRGSLYQHVDNYTLFYYRFLEGGNLVSGVASLAGYGMS